MNRVVARALEVDLFGQSSLSRVQIEQTSAVNASDNAYVPERLSLGATIGFRLGF